jgi:hypothetical protein
MIKAGDADIDQCYWHYTKTDELEDKTELREFPSYDFEAFIAGGKPFFGQDALLWYQNRVAKPIKEAMYVSAL